MCRVPLFHLNNVFYLVLECFYLFLYVLALYVIHYPNKVSAIIEETAKPPYIMPGRVFSYRRMR